MIVRNEEQAIRLLKGYLRAPYVTFDTETHGEEANGVQYSALILPRARLTTFQLKAPGEQGYVFFVGGGSVVRECELSFTRLFPHLRALMESPDVRKVMHNATYDYWVMLNYGIVIRNFYCTLVAGACYNEDLPNSLKERAVLVGMLLKKTRTINFDDEQDLADYGLTDIVATEKLYEYYEGIQHRSRLVRVGGNRYRQCVTPVKGEPQLGGVRRRFFEQQELPFLNLCIRMEQTGVRIDLKKLSGIDTRISVDMAAHEKKIYHYAGGPFKLSAPKQMAEVLFDKLGLECPEDCYTAKGAPSTNARTLFYLSGAHPIVQHLLEYRKLAKLREVYTNPESGLPYYCDNAGVIHASINVGAAKTGRLSASQPNLMTIPSRRDTYGIRDCFIAPPGHKLIVFDYSQIEVRMQTIYSRDPKLIGVYAKNGDVYLLVANEYHSPDPRKERDMYKVVVLALQYGMGAWTFADRMTMEGYPTTPTAGKKMIAHYFEHVFPHIPLMWERLFREHARNGYVPMITGFPRHIEDFETRFHAGTGKYGLTNSERMLINNLMQGCLSGDQRIFVRGLGSVPISYVPQGVRLSVWDGETYAEGCVVSSGRKRLLDIELQGGVHLKCSPEHRFLTVNTLGNEHWKTAEQFSKQEYIRLADPLPNAPEGYWGTPAPLLHPGKSKNSRGVDFRVLPDVRLGEWLGRVASDGSCMRGKGVTLLVADSEEDIYEQLKRDTLALVPHVSERRQQGKRVRDIHAACKVLADYLLDTGLKSCIPAWVWDDRERLRGYLRGMFDGDGTVSPSGSVYLTFGRAKTHQAWAEQIQQALLLFGVRSRVQPMCDRTNVQIQKRDVGIYAREIGFMSRTKRERLRSAPAARRGDGNRYGRMARVVRVTDTGRSVAMYDFVNSTTERFAVNGVVTHNSAAHWIKQAMLRLDASAKLRRMGYKQALQIHDEVFGSAPAAVAEEALAEVVREAEQPPSGSFAPVYDIPIPIVAAGGLGDTWSEAKKDGKRREKQK